MSSATFGPDLSLTPDQEGLLRTALSSNPADRHSPQKPLNGVSGYSHAHNGSKEHNSGSMANGTNMYISPVQETPGSGLLDSFDDSPSLDFENLEDGNFDWDTTGEQLFGDLPGGEYNDDEHENHDKRKASIDDEDEEEGASKRREGDDKTVKKAAQKPGRKPLTGEPTTKRKAQNRAAQRAFRERKERHLKDLETKVDDLTKASESANHENGRLRATVDKLNVELKEYRKRLSMNVAGASHSPPRSATQPRGLYNGSSNGGDFSFAFPKFGDLPGSFLNNGSIAKTISPTQDGLRSASSSSVNIPAMPRQESSISGKPVSPTNVENTGTENPNKPAIFQAPRNGFGGNDYGELSGLFSPSILESAKRNNSTEYVSFPSSFPGSRTTSTSSHKQKGSTNTNKSRSQVPNVRQGSSASITNSPASSMSHALDSSCGTTPESSAESPDNRKGSEGVLNTINEDPKPQFHSGAASNLVTSPAADLNSFDWMAQQNGGQFDPVLFGDYRDPQDNILNNSFGDFFNDAFPLNDFSSPYNIPDTTNQPPKKDFIKEIEVRQNSNPEQLPPTDKPEQFLTCDRLWDRVQTLEKGEAEMDDLCSQLKSKAKCSGKGAVIAQKDVDEILGPAPPEQADFLKMFS